jgi:hypothetical protein
LEWVVKAHTELNQWELALTTNQQLLQKHPHQWHYWKDLIIYAFRINGYEGACQMVEEQLQQCARQDDPFPSRSQLLVQCELAARSVYDETTTTALRRLQESIVEYGFIFCSKASCAYADLAPYLELLIITATSNDNDDDVNDDDSVAQSILTWAWQLREDNRQQQPQSNGDGESSSVDHAKLRSYIFAIQRLAT